MEILIFYLIVCAYYLLRDFDLNVRKEEALYMQQKCDFILSFDKNVCVGVTIYIFPSFSFYTQTVNFVLFNKNNLSCFRCSSNCCLNSTLDIEMQFCPFVRKERASSLFPCEALSSTEAREKEKGNENISTYLISEPLCVLSNNW